MSNLYQEAIADAKRLKELAEENAKNKILSEIAPRIKRLIEAELSADSDDEYGEWEDDQEDSEDEAEGDDLSPSAELEDMEDLDVPDLGVADSDDETMDLEGLSGPEAFGVGLEASDSPIEVSGEGEHSIETEDGKKVTVNITVEGERRRLAQQLFENLSGPRTAYQLAAKRFKFLKSQLKEAKNTKKRRKILAEMRKLQKTLIFNNDRSSLNLAKNINEILKENDMSRRTRRNRRLNENAWWLREAEGDELEDEGLEDDLGDDELEDDEELEDEAAGGESIAVEDLAAALAPVLGVDEDELIDLAGGGEALEDEDDLEDDEEDELEDDEDLEDDVDEYDEMMEADAEEGDGDEGDDDEVVEINEAMIRRELAKLRKNSRRRRTVRESRKRRRRPASRRRRMFEAEAKQVADNFGGGKLDKEHFVEVDEETLLNALAEELGSDANAEKGGSAAKGVKAFGGGSAKAEAIKESRRRARKAKLLERKNKKLQKELKESNLFNAKLLYVNKLMQQHDLNSKQQRAIVEAIDNAKTLREAKLLYSSLTESLRKRAANKASLNESAVRTGSASKSLRSSAPAKSGEGLDRWAVLAGIKK